MEADADRPAEPPEAAVEHASAERPARERKEAFAAMHEDRDTEERPLTLNEKRQLRKLSQQMVSFRLWLSAQDRPPPCDLLRRCAYPSRLLPKPCIQRKQDECNIYWDELHGLTSPTLPMNVTICPQREELHLSKNLMLLKPMELRTDVPPEDKIAYTAYL